MITEIQTSSVSTPVVPQSRTTALSPEVPIPKRLAGHHQYLSGEMFLRLASGDSRDSIPMASWKAFTPEQQQYVTDSLEARGLCLMRSGGQVAVVNSDAVEIRPLVFRAKNTTHEFLTNDSRIRHSSEIHLTVMNADTAREATTMIRQFIADVMKYGLEVS